MRILVTGAAGFIGSNLAKAFIEAGHQVAGVDDMSGGDRRNLEGLPSSDSFRFYEIDLADYAAVERVSPPSGVALIGIGTPGSHSSIILTTVSFGAP